MHIGLERACGFGLARFGGCLSGLAVARPRASSARSAAAGVSAVAPSGQ